MTVSFILHHYVSFIQFFLSFRFVYRFCDYLTQTGRPDNTAVSIKVVKQKCKSVRDNVESDCG